MVYAHPFAEEMNKSRRMAALQARALADAGWAVLLPDLLGCGDSDGDFGDATWAAWVDDLVAHVNWMRQRFDDGNGQALPLWLWGLRAGCLLASQAAARIDDLAGLLLWQPAGAGKQALQQFLRLKTAAAMLSGGPKGGTDALRNQLLAGAAVDVAGYRLSPGLALGMEAATLTPPVRPLQVEWFEVGGGADPTLSPAAAATAQRWRDAGSTVQTHVVSGPPFWQATEIEVAHDLLAATTAALTHAASLPQGQRVLTPAP